MIAALAALPGGLKWAMAGAVAVLVLALGGSVWFNLRQAEAAGALTAQLHQTAELAQHNADQALALSAEWARSDAIAARQIEAERLARRSLNQFIDEVLHAPPEDDAPCAPVLCRVLERLRYDNHRDQGGAGAAPPVPGAAVAH